MQAGTRRVTNANLADTSRRPARSGARFRATMAACELSVPHFVEERFVAADRSNAGRRKGFTGADTG
jgi:hypothetical protein